VIVTTSFCECKIEERLEGKKQHNVNAKIRGIRYLLQFAFFFAPTDLAQLVAICFLTYFGEWMVLDFSSLCWRAIGKKKGMHSCI
jgi:hypothetical protein